MKGNHTQLSRRSFVAGTATAMTALTYSRVLGANERIGVGFIGVGLVGTIHLRDFLAQPDAHVTAISETFQPRLAAAQGIIGGGAQGYRDFRRLLDDPAVDAVVVSTPDHWHALQTMMACAAGKDVYVEKPLHRFVREGEWMQRVATRCKSVIQVGTQQRSAPHYQRAKALLRGGAIGEVVGVQCNFFRNIMPGVGQPPDGQPPADLDWDMMLGPAPWHPYNPNRAMYHFRWFWDHSGGQMTNLGHHSLDIVHWIFDLQMPRAVASSGGRFFLKDNAEVPDTQDAIIEYPKFPVVVQIRECAAQGKVTGTACASSGSMGPLVFLGTKGTLTLDRDGYTILPDRKLEPANVFARNVGTHPVGGPQPVPAVPDAEWCEKAVDNSGDQKAQFVLHVRNFLDCVKSRGTPNSDLASSHQVSTVCHLANLSLRTGRKLVWDAAAGEIAGDKPASEMLLRPYRAPWDAELRAVLG